MFDDVSAGDENDDCRQETCTASLMPEAEVRASCGFFAPMMC